MPSHKLLRPRVRDMDRASLIVNKTLPLIDPQSYSSNSWVAMVVDDFTLLLVVGSRLRASSACVSPSP